jgi:hypothetical protein
MLVRDAGTLVASVLLVLSMATLFFGISSSVNAMKDPGVEQEPCAASQV